MIVETHALAKRYRGVAALNGLSMSVAEGSAFALIGANGAGKTTVLKLLINLLKPSSGRASVLGVDSQKISHPQLAQIGYVSENQVLPGRLTVADYFDYLRSFYENWDRSIENRLRRDLDLPAARRIRDLSHGMRMKMALVCALPFRPRLLILDEPLSGLDPLARDEVMEGLLSHAGETTIVISSQELAEIEHVVTHVGFLDSGQLLFQDAMSDLGARVKQVRVVLDAPAAAPPGFPPEWIDVRASGNVLTFVDTQNSEEALDERLKTFVPGVRRVEAEAMPLRSIFVSLARAMRERARSAEGAH